MTRLSAERLKEIDFHAAQFHHNSSAIDDVDGERAIMELLAELREVTRERDEAREKGSSRAMVELYKSKYLDTVKLSTALEQERDRLIAEVERLEKMVSTNIMHVEIAALRAELVTADIREHDLRVELAKYKAAVESLFVAIAHGDEAHRMWLKSAIEKHFALDAKPGQEGG